MRNPERIDPLLEKISRIWKANPDLRLTQLIMNVIPGSSAIIIYAFEDDDLMQALDFYYAPSSSAD